jgi:hypothetical protein
MITATDQAAEFLAEAMQTVSLDTSVGECFRIEKEGEAKLAIVRGRQAEGDVAITHGDATVLVIEPALADEIGERTLDVQDAGQGQKTLFWK